MYESSCHNYFFAEQIGNGKGHIRISIARSFNLAFGWHPDDNAQNYDS